MICTHTHLPCIKEEAKREIRNYFELHEKTLSKFVACDYSSSERETRIVGKQKALESKTSAFTSRNLSKEE
jgi:hypothetical protein